MQKGIRHSKNEIQWIGLNFKIEKIEIKFSVYQGN